MCAQLRQVPRHMVRELLRELGGACLAWFQHPTSEALASAGLTAFRQLTEAVVISGDSDALLEALDLAEAVAVRQVSTVTEALRQQRQRPAVLPWAGIGAGGGGGGRNSRPGQAAADAALRLQCRMLLLLQRVLGALLQRLVLAQAPWALQSRLLFILSSLVRQAATFNTEQVTHDGDTALYNDGAGAARSGSSTSSISNAAGNRPPQSDFALARGNSGEVADDILGSTTVGVSATTLVRAPSNPLHAAAARTNRPLPTAQSELHFPATGPSAPSTPHLHAPLQALSPPMEERRLRRQASVALPLGALGGASGHLGTQSAAGPGGLPPILSSPSSVERVVPSLARLEVEGGLALIAALQQLQPSGSGRADTLAGQQQGGAGGGARSAAYQLGSNGTASAAAGRPAPSSPEELLVDLCYFFVATHAATLSPVGRLDSLAQDGPVGCQGIRAPLLVYALSTLGSLASGANGQRHLQALFPLLVVLVQSPQPTVRRAVAQYMSLAVGPVLLKVGTC